jgi:hypothetical protein
LRTLIVACSPCRYRLSPSSLTFVRVLPRRLSELHHPRFHALRAYSTLLLVGDPFAEFFLRCSQLFLLSSDICLCCIITFRRLFPRSAAEIPSILRGLREFAVSVCVSRRPTRSSFSARPRDLSLGLRLLLQELILFRPGPQWIVLLYVLLLEVFPFDPCQAFLGSASRAALFRLRRLASWPLSFESKGLVGLFSVSFGFGEGL